jgi:hypothetical protein
MAKSEDEGGLEHFWRSSEFWPGAPLPVGDKKPETGTGRGIGWQKSEHLPGFWGLRRSSEMKNKAGFEQILEMKMPFNGRNGRKIEAFWQLGGVEMRAIPFGGLKLGGVEEDVVDNL